MLKPSGCTSKLVTTHDCLMNDAGHNRYCSPLSIRKNCMLRNTVKQNDLSSDYQSDTPAMSVRSVMLGKIIIALNRIPE